MQVIKALCVILLLTGCTSTLSRLENIGKVPEVTPPENPTERSNYRPVSLPMPAANTTPRMPNSLWVPGRRSFFKDQRANNVGDLVTVLININDEAKLDNTTERTRTNADDSSFGTLLGVENKIKGWLPGAPSLAPAISTNGTSTNKGDGKIDRKEEIKLRVAAVIAQVLPNGNMVVAGRQEVRVNFEVRDLQVGGIIRPEDISTDNTIPFEKIAEGRVSYGGRGNIFDAQQPRYGQQVLDVLLPF
jgi:flagellar L-ring protein precursor FlgH